MRLNFRLNFRLNLNCFASVWRLVCVRSSSDLFLHRCFVLSWVDSDAQDFGDASRIAPSGSNDSLIRYFQAKDLTLKMADFSLIMADCTPKMTDLFTEDDGFYAKNDGFLY